MSSKALQSLVSARFNVNFSTHEHLMREHNTYFGDTKLLDNAGLYLRARLAFLVSQLTNRQEPFPSYLFHALVGCLVTNQCPSNSEIDEIKEYVLGLRRQGGFLAARADYLNQFPKLRSAKVSPMVPEVYSSYYSYFTLKLLNVPFTEEEMESLASWIIAHQKQDGAIYNDTYSDTLEERRFETEVVSQTYFGSALLTAFAENLPELDLHDSLIKAERWALRKWQGLRTVAGRYFALKIVDLVQSSNLNQIGSAETIGFLSDRLDEVRGGYYDYRLSDKIDEFMSSPSATELDKISPHVFSTYYAVSIMKMLWASGVNVKIPNEVIRQLAFKALNPDSGFGMKVMVKDFPDPYGPVSTELETLLIALFPLLVQIET